MRDERPSHADAPSSYAPLLPPALTQWNGAQQPPERGPLLPPFIGLVSQPTGRVSGAPPHGVGPDVAHDTGIAPPALTGLEPHDATAEEGFVAAAEEANEAERGGAAELPADFGVSAAAERPAAAWPAEDEAYRAAAAAPAFADEAADGRTETAAALAGQLEQLAAELREHGETALHSRLTRGSRLEALLAAVLAGYLAGGSED